MALCQGFGESLPSRSLLSNDGVIAYTENANNKPGTHNATERLCEVVSLHLESTSHVQALYKVYSKVISTMTLR